MIPVTPRPVRKPLALPVVNLPRRVLRVPPARLSNACPITFIPKRKRHRPPMRDRKSKISMFVSFQ